MDTKVRNERGQLEDIRQCSRSIAEVEDDGMKSAVPEPERDRSKSKVSRVFLLIPLVLQMLFPETLLSRGFHFPISGVDGIVGR